MVRTYMTRELWPTTSAAISSEWSRLSQLLPVSLFLSLFPTQDQPKKASKLPKSIILDALLLGSLFPVFPSSNFQAYHTWSSPFLPPTPHPIKFCIPLCIFQSLPNTSGGVDSLATVNLNSLWSYLGGLCLLMFSLRSHQDTSCTAQCCGLQPSAWCGIHRGLCLLLMARQVHANMVSQHLIWILCLHSLYSSAIYSQFNTQILFLASTCHPW